MTATLAVRHRVKDYGAWLAVYEEAEQLRIKYGCTAKRVMRLPDDQNELFVTHEFPSLEQASGFAGDPGLREAMDRSGVDGMPRIEIFTDV
jgi:hypothetical protein